MPGRSAGGRADDHAPSILESVCIVRQPQACSIRAHNGAPTSLLHQSELNAGSDATVITCRCLGVAARTLHPSERGAKTSTHLESTSASHNGAAASLLDQSELHGESKYLQVPGWSASGRDEHDRVLSPPPTRIVQQPPACSIYRSFMEAPLQR